MLTASTRIIVSCEGSGAITVTGDVVEMGKVITKDTPFIFSRNSASPACNLNLTVSGNLNHAQVELATGEAFGLGYLSSIAQEGLVIEYFI